MMRWTVMGTALAVALATSPATADDSTCDIAGSVVVASGTAVFDAQSGGTQIAQLTGAEAPVRLRSFPSKQSGATRVQMSTTKNGGYLRIDGWVALDAFRYFAAVDIPVPGAQAQVWISQSRPLKIVDASGDKLTVEYDVLGSRDATAQGPQRLRALVGCRAVSLVPQPPEVGDVPERASSFTMKESILELFDQPNGSAVFTLRMDEQARKPFWSTESRGGFVHVISRADLTIDAWARRSTLEQLRRGEAFVQQVPQVTPIPAKTLALEGSPAPLTATTELAIHARPDADKAIGALEVGAKLYTMEKSHEWTNVLPADLAIMPSDGSGFWVKTSGLPKP